MGLSGSPTFFGSMRASSCGQVPHYLDLLSFIQINMAAIFLSTAARDRSETDVTQSMSETSKSLILLKLPLFITESTV